MRMFYTVLSPRTLLEHQVPLQRLHVGLHLGRSYLALA